MIKSVGQSISAAIEANRLREGGKTRASSATGSTTALPDDAPDAAGFEVTDTTATWARLSLTTSPGRGRK